MCAFAAKCSRSTARVRYARGEDELDAVDEFGQRIAADFIIVHKDSRLTETVVLVVRDEATGYIRAFPLVARDTDSTVRSLLSFMGRYAAGPCALFKSDNARELLSACATLGFTSEPSLERRWPHNAVLERELRTLEECTRALHIASGFQLHAGLWVHTVRYAAHTLNLFHPAVGIEGSRYVNAVGSEFEGMKLQLGQLVYYRLAPYLREKFQASAAPGIFAGWRFDSGPKSFRQVYQILDYGKLKNREPGFKKAISVPKEELHVPRGDPILPMFTAAETALSGFTQAEYEAIDFLDVPFSAVAPSTPVAKRHEYITLDRLIRLGATPGCKACKFDAVTHTPVCKARFDGLIKAEKIAASKSVKGAAPPDVERAEPSGESAPAAPEGAAAAPEAGRSSHDRPAAAGVMILPSGDNFAKVRLVLSEKFLANEKARHKTRRVGGLPGENVLIEYGCEDESEVSDACERCKVHCVSVSQSTLDLASQDNVQQVVAQAIPGVDAWFNIQCTHMTSHQSVNRDSHGPKYARKLSQRQAASKRMLTLALNVADHITCQGGRVSFEWGHDSGVLKQPEWVEFSSRHELSLVECVKGNKPVVIASNSKRVLECFAKTPSVDPSNDAASGIDPREYADLVVEALYPQRFFKRVPSFSATNALITKSLTRREWQSDPRALEAIKLEADGLRANETWDDSSVMTLQQLRSQARARGQKLRVAEVMTLCGLKHAELAPEFQRFKGRIVYRGDRVLDEFNNLVFFEETSTSPTGLVALNASLFWGSLPGHEVSCSDAVQAYLQSELREETYVILPKELWLEGWEQRFGGQTKLVVRLRKSLYGHPQAGRLWQEYLARILVSLGGQESREFPSNWFFEYSSGILILNIYVDDLSLCGLKKLHKPFWEALRARVKLDPECYIGREGVRVLGRMHCRYDGPMSTTMAFKMPEYAEQIVQTYCEITGTSPDKLRRVSTPCNAESAMTDEEIATQGDLHDSAARILMRCLWLARLCRPDISFAVTRLASRVTRWTAWEDRQTLRLVSHIHHTREVCMHASCSWDAPPVLNVYTDADFAACPYTAKSTSGIVAHIGTGSLAWPVMWQSRKQSSVARSTPEAELISMASAMFSEVINLQTFLGAAFKTPVPVVFHQDNEAALAILKIGYSAKLRHLGRVHRVNVASMSEILDQEHFSAEYIKSKDQLANGLTKIIPPAEWPEMLVQLCLSDASPQPAAVSKAVVDEAERFASNLPRKVTQDDLLALMTYLPGEDASRPTAADTTCFSTGAFAHGGGIAGLRQNVATFPNVTSVLCRFVRMVLPRHKFTAILLARGHVTLMHRDSFNEPGSRNAVIPLEEFQGGHLWIQSETGQFPCPDQSRGERGDILSWPAIFDPRRLHATTPCTKGRRTVIIAYTPRNVSKLSVEQRLELQRLASISDNGVETTSQVDSLNSM